MFAATEPTPAPNCCVCDKPRNPKDAKAYQSQALLDPFCSTECCKGFYGVKDAVYDREGAEPKRKRQQRPRWSAS